MEKAPVRPVTPSALTPVRPLVLAAALGYRREALHRFIASCRRHVPAARIVLFASDLDPASLDWLRSLPEVQVITDTFNRPSVRQGWRLAASQWRTRLAHALARGLADAAFPADDDPVADALSSVVVQRFFRYRRFLAGAGDEFTHVFLTDIRDVVFQADPFPCDGLHVFAEDEQIAQSHFARRWFQLAYGWSSWRRWAQCPLLNVGTILGDVRAVRQYLEVACREYRTRRAFFWGADTAVHNQIVHAGLVGAVVHPFGAGAVLTLNAIPRERLRVESGRVLDTAGRPYPVLHQYDRVHDLQLDPAFEPAARTDSGGIS